MTGNIGHIKNEDWGRFIVRQMIICLALVVSIGQFSVVSHAHEVHEDAPQGQHCAVCILATHNDDSAGDDSGGDDVDDDLKDNHFEAHLRKSELALVEAQLAQLCPFYSNILAPPGPLIFRRHAPRAPPIYI